MTGLTTVTRCAAGIALGVALVGGALALTGGVGHAQQTQTAGNSAIYCQGYAQEAVRMYRTYSNRRCGNLINQVWHPDYGVHYGYCMRTTLANAAWIQRLRYQVISNQCGDGFARPPARPQPRRS